MAEIGERLIVDAPGAGFAERHVLPGAPRAIRGQPHEWSAPPVGAKGEAGHVALGD
jgi:hypothetical protein